jgi:CBS domain-containing protein
MARIGDVMTLRVVAVAPHESAHVAIARMLEENVGSVAVCDGDQLVGIFTERDVLRLAGQEGGIGDPRVGDVMTRNVVTVTPDDDVVDAASIMGERRIRHLPVVVDGKLCGVVGIRDVLRILVELLWRDHDADARERARDLLKRA